MSHDERATIMLDLLHVANLLGSFGKNGMAIPPSYAEDMLARLHDAIDRIDPNKGAA
jgi:hypothetical protein